eukprot:bmy_20229T0
MDFWGLQSGHMDAKVPSLIQTRFGLQLPAMIRATLQMSLPHFTHSLHLGCSGLSKFILSFQVSPTAH